MASAKIQLSADGGLSWLPADTALASGLGITQGGGNASVYARLDSTAGVNSVSWSIVSSSEGAAELTLSVQADKSIHTLVPRSDPAAWILRAVVNGGIDPRAGTADPNLVSALAIKVLTATGLELLAPGEGDEGDRVFGWTTPVNAAILASGGGGGGGGSALPSPWTATVDGGGNLTVDAPSVGSGNGRASIVKAQNTTASSAYGGAMDVAAGTSTIGTGGNASIKGGSGASGGGVVVSGGIATGGTGGTAVMYGGSGPTPGSASVFGGNAAAGNSNGANARLAGGDGHGSGSGDGGFGSVDGGSGNGTGNGGAGYLSGGNCYGASKTAGLASVRGGNASGATSVGGGATVAGGTGTATGGDVNFTPGLGASSAPGSTIVTRGKFIVRETSGVGGQQNETAILTTATTTATLAYSYAMATSESVSITVLATADNGTTTGEVVKKAVFRRTTGDNSGNANQQGGGATFDASVAAFKLSHDVTIALNGNAIEVKVVAAAATSTLWAVGVSIVSRTGPV